jgi:hypothetical protein
MGKYTSDKFDKFKDRTDTSWVDPNNKVFGGPWGTWFWEIESSSLGLGLRHVKVANSDSLVIDYRYYSKDWMFIRSGGMIINIDGKNINLDSIDTNGDVRDGGRINEVGYFRITKENLKLICDGENIAVRISGDSTYIELKDKGLLKFQFMCRSFYSDFYNESIYDDWLNKIIPPGSEKGSCFVATATLGDYDHPVVIDLRNFRDNWLVKRKWGIRFRDFYYSNGPKAAHFIAKSKILRKFSLFLVIKPLRFLIVKLKLIK